MLLNEVVFREKLEKLNTTQQSIENTAAWALFHRADARRVAEVWEDFFSKADQAKRLAMVYLANDILQTGRKKGTEFLAEFFRVLPRALRHMLAKADDKTKTSVNKVIRVWDERKVFGSSGSKTFHELVHGADVASPPSQRTQHAGAGAGAAGAGVAAATPTAAQQLPAPVAQLADTLQQAAAAAQRTAQLQAATAASVPAAMGPAADTQQVAAACAALQDLLSSLQQEAGRRQLALGLLRQAAAEQEGCLAQAMAAQQFCSQQLAQLDSMLSQVEAAGAAGQPLAMPQAYMQQEPLMAGAQWGAAAAPAAAFPMQQLAQQQPPPPQQQTAAAAPAAPLPPMPHMQQEVALPPPAQGQADAAQQHPAPQQAQQQQQAVTANAEEAASLAAALAQNQNSAEALLAAFMALPQDQQEGLGVELAGFLQPAGEAGGEGEAAADDLYDPEDL